MSGIRARVASPEGHNSSDRSREVEIDEEPKSVDELHSLLEVWAAEHENPSYNVHSTLVRLAELVESGVDGYLKRNPDPFDERRPWKIDSSSEYAQILRVLSREEAFIGKLMITYVHSHNDELALATTRLLLSIMPVVDPETFTDNSSDFIGKMFNMVKKDNVEMQCYAVGVLAAAMSDNETESQWHEQNLQIVPLMIDKLRTLLATDTAVTDFRDIPRETFKDSSARPELADVLADSAEGCGSSAPVGLTNGMSDADQNNGLANGLAGKSSDVDDISPTPTTSSVGVDSAARVTSGKHVTRRNSIRVHRKDSSGSDSGDYYRPPSKRQATDELMAQHDQMSSSNWSVVQPYVFGSHCLHPLSTHMQCRLILQYLTQIAACQDLISVVVEKQVLPLLLGNCTVTPQRDVRLSLECLKYMAALCVHRKFALEVVNLGGVKTLCQVQRDSIASAGVAYVLAYIALIEDVFEKLCLSSRDEVEMMVSYALWLVEHAYETGRCDACMFFVSAFKFAPFVEVFDQNDGIRILHNYLKFQMSTLAVMHPDGSSSLSEEQIAQSQQAVSAVVAAFRSYFIGHLYIKVEQFKRWHRHNQIQFAVNPPAFPPGSTQKSKAMLLDYSSMCECVNWLTQVWPAQSSWRPVQQCHKYECISSLLFLCSEFSDSTWAAKPKSALDIKSALDVLHMASIVPLVQMSLMQPLMLSQNIKSDGINVVLTLCEGASLNDAEVQRSALNVIINCVCAPEVRPTYSASASTPSHLNNASSSLNTSITHLNKPRRSSIMPPPAVMFLPHIGPDPMELLKKMWACVRRNNGIMVLRWLLFVRSPVTEADSLRALACKALEGMARSNDIAQMLAKMSIITNDELQGLAREPVCTDRRTDHIKFCGSVRSLLQRVTGRDHPDVVSDFASDLSLERLLRTKVVAQTNIEYDKTELLQLIYLHLRKQGLLKTAACLGKEAKLPSVPASCVAKPVAIDNLPHRVTHAPTPTPGTSRQSAVIPFRKPASGQSMQLGAGMTSMIGGISSHLRRQRMRPRTVSKTARLDSFTLRVKNKANLPAIRSPSQNKQVQPVIDLDDIVVDHFRKQHALCPNPVSACPPFSLFYRHRCPDRQPLRSAPLNIAQRLAMKSTYFPPHGGAYGRRRDLQLIFSRFRPVKAFIDAEHEDTFTCCTFTLDDANVLCGTYAGDLKLFDIASGAEQMAITSMHSSAINSIRLSKNGEHMLSSSAYVRPLSALWKVNGWSEEDNQLEKLLDIDSEYNLEFCHRAPQDWAVGTNAHKAKLFDLHTGSQIVELWDTERANFYTRNKATVHPDDSLLLSDGLLWDIRSKKMIHKFDKLNPHVSGVFHPNGIHVIINSEVWDIRTYRLLHTVPQLDQCKLVFNSTGDIILAVVQSPHDDDNDEATQEGLSRSLRTVDASTYELVATTDARHALTDIAIDNTHDMHCALIERNSHDSYSTYDDTTCVRVYEVGRQRVEDEEQEDEQPQAEDEEDGFDDDDDDEEDGMEDIIEFVDDEDDDSGSGESDDASGSGGDDDGDNDDDDDPTSNAAGSHRSGSGSALGAINDTSNDADAVMLNSSDDSDFSMNGMEEDGVDHEVDDASSSDRDSDDDDDDEAITDEEDATSESSSEQNAVRRRFAGNMDTKRRPR